MSLRVGVAIFWRVGGHNSLDGRSANISEGRLAISVEGRGCIILEGRVCNIFEGIVAISSRVGVARS
jgi:hypothetical protein